MSEEQNVEKDDWRTILEELDEIVREINRFSSMVVGDKDTFEDDVELPALIHFINELKKEKKNKSWEKIDKFVNQTKNNLTFLEETQQIKMQNKLIDKSFLGVLPKNTNEIGKNTIEILNEIPSILRIINESVEALLIDIKLKLGFPIVKFEKEILEIKHQIDLLEEEINTHSKTKKGFASKEEQLVYTQAYRETYHEIIEKAENYIIRDFEIHSNAFQDVYERYQNKIKKYRESPAFDDFIKENCNEIEKTINKWATSGFKVFNDAQKFIRKIEHRLSDTRQTFIQQIKADLEKDVNKIISTIENFQKIESKVKPQAFSKIKDSSEKLISSLKFYLRTVDVVSDDPYEKLVNDEKIVNEAKNITATAFDATFGKIESKLEKYVKKITLAKNTKKLIKKIDQIEDYSKDPNNLDDSIKAIPSIIEYEKTLNLLFKEMAVDIVDTQNKYLKKIKNINKYLGKADAVTIPDDSEIVKIEKVDLEDEKSLGEIEDLLKKPLAESAKVLAEYENIFSEGLGISINPKLKSKAERYKRPSYKPTIKKANRAMRELEKFAKTLAEDAGKAISDYYKELRKFSVKTSALETFRTLLKNLGKDASKGKLTLSQITVKLEKAIEEYSRLLEEELEKYSEELKPLLKDEALLNISSDISLENFTLKHDEFISNISLESVMEQQQDKEEKPKLKCKKCGAVIVWQQEDYNEMLGFDVLKVRCENNHEDTLIGFGDEKEEEEKEEEEPIEVKCEKCNSTVLTPIDIDIFSKKELKITASCEKRHKTEFVIKKL